MNRAARRRDARRIRAGRMLYHGTAGYLADRIRRDGLRPGADGRVYLTDSLAMAQRYAMWSTALAATVTDPADFAPLTDVGREVVRHAPFGAAVAHVHLPAGVQIRPERSSSAPPLPWETTMGDDGGRAFYVTRAIPAGQITPWQVWRVEELDQPGALDAVRRDSEAIAATYRRSDEPSDRAPGAAGRFSDAVPDPLGLVLAVMEANPDAAASPWHGHAHWRGVAAAGLRVLEAGCPADPAVVFCFAVLHDVAHDTHYGDHGARAAALARSLAGTQHQLDAGQLDTLCAALVDHDRGLVSDDVTVGACWDADRLTLPRLGITPDPALLSTVQGRALAAGPVGAPDQDACDWAWVAFRYTLVSASPEPYAAR